MSDVDELEERWLEAYRTVSRADPAAKARVLARLGGAYGAPSSPAPASKAVSGALGGKVLVAGLVVAGVVAVVGLAGRSSSTGTPPRPVERERAATQTVSFDAGVPLLESRPELVEPSEPMEPSVPESELDDPRSPVPKRPRTKRPARERDKTEAPESTVRVETKMLFEVESALRRKAGKQAVGLLTAYFERFPSGHLRAEADALRVIAGCLEGAANSSENAMKHLERAPNDRFAARIRRNCLKPNEPASGEAEE